MFPFWNKEDFKYSKAKIESFPRGAPPADLLIHSFLWHLSIVTHSDIKVNDLWLAGLQTQNRNLKIYKIQTTLKGSGPIRGGIYAPCSFQN